MRACAGTVGVAGQVLNVSIRVVGGIISEDVEVIADSGRRWAATRRLGLSLRAEVWRKISRARTRC
jgi:hypothetical protein